MQQGAVYLPHPLHVALALTLCTTASTRHANRVVEWLRDFAQQRQLKVQQDTKGNVVIYKNGQAGGESAPTVIIQV